MRLIKVAAAVLNQTPLDWDGNKARIIAAIEGDQFEHYLPDMKGIVEYKTTSADEFLAGAAAM